MKRMTIATLGICLSINAAAGAPVTNGYTAIFSTTGGTIRTVTGLPCVFTISNGQNEIGPTNNGNGVSVHFIGDENAILHAQAFTPNCEKVDPVPEIDGASATLGLGLAAALIVVFRERRRRITKVSAG